MEGTDGGEVGWPRWEAEDLKAKKSWMWWTRGDRTSHEREGERKRGGMWDQREQRDDWGNLP